MADCVSRVRLAIHNARRRNHAPSTRTDERSLPMRMRLMPRHNRLGPDFKMSFQTYRSRGRLVLAPLFALGFLALWGTAEPAAKHDQDIDFNMVRSAALNAFPSCVPNASSEVRIESAGPVEEMTVKVEGLPPNTDFDFFVIQ